MKLLSCQIENFGKLSKKEFRFTDGKNVIFEENGFGKSTLASFIRAMFYGLEGTKTRDEFKNEARRFGPWQGGSFGGRLVFETKGKTYAITRFFDKKGNTEVFECRDFSTNLLSGDFTENIGEELFDINRESFMRSVFIGQDDLVTEATDSIHGKMGGNEDHTGDLRLYDAADFFLKTVTDKLTPTRITGLAASEKKEAEELKRELSNKIYTEEAYEKQQKLWEEKREELLTIRAEREALQELQRIKSEEKAKNEVQKLLQEKKEKLAEQERLTEKKKASFGNQVPSIESIRQHIELANTLLTEEAREKETAFSAEDNEKMAAFRNQFAGGVPSEEELSHYEEMAVSLARKHNDFREKRMTDNEKRSLASFSAQLEKKKEELKAREAEKEKGKKLEGLSVLFLILGLGAVLTGFFLPDVQFICVAFGGAFLIAFFLLFLTGNKKKKTDLTETEKESEQLEKEVELLKKKEQEFDEALAAREILSAQNTLESFLQRYHLVDGNGIYLDDLNLLRNQLKTFNEMQKQEAIHREALENKKALKQSLDAFYAELGQTIGENLVNLSIYKQNLNMILEKRISFDHMLEETLKMQQDVKTYEEAHSAETSEKETVSPAYQALTLEEVNRLLDNNREKENGCYEVIQETEKSMGLLLEKLEELEEKEERLQKVTKAYENHLQAYQDGQKARDFLKQAKDSLTNRFAKPVYDAFCQYFILLTKSSGMILPKDFTVDARAKLSFLDNGLQHQVESLSKGYQDLVNLCLRFAYIDAMYPEEKPTVFLDDPFTNLDTEKVKQGLTFLDRISEKYQVIYFTCHESRK